MHHKTFARTLLALLAGLTALAPAARAVVVNDPAGSTLNTAAPTSDPGWANVGLCGTGSAIYLQDNWVLTAYHVGAGTVNFGGTNYTQDATQPTIRVKNSDGSNADMVLFRLASTPAGVRDLTIASSTPAANKTLTMIGYGRTQQTSLTTWYVDTATDPDTWSEIPGSGTATRTGFKTTSARTKQWGTNKLYDTLVLNNVYGKTSLFRTDFDTSGDECQAINGDSGGAVFVLNGSEWQLAGMIDVTYTQNGQPSYTAVHGTYTGIADLSVYREQILDTLAIPEPGTLALLAAGGALAGLRRRRNG